MTREIKIVIEQHSDRYVAYPLGIKGSVVGEGGTYEEALREVTIAIRRHVEAFGSDVLDTGGSILDAFITAVPIEMNNASTVPSRPVIDLYPDPEEKRSSRIGRAPMRRPVAEAPAQRRPPQMALGEAAQGGCCLACSSVLCDACIGPNYAL